MTTLLDFLLAGTLEEEGPGNGGGKGGSGDGDDDDDSNGKASRGEAATTTTQTEKRLTHADRVGGFAVSCLVHTRPPGSPTPSSGPSIALVWVASREHPRCTAHLLAAPQATAEFELKDGLPMVASVAIEKWLATNL